MSARALLAAAFLLAAATAPAQPAPCEVERIESFDAAIEVRASGTVAVTETIVFCARGEAIRRGIFRDVPTRHRTPMGVYEHRPLSLSDASIEPARADGDAFVGTGPAQPALARSEAHGEGVRWYLGGAGELAPGLWRIALAYESEHPLRHFDGYDELYWNATGDGWDFAIAKATATVFLPEGASTLQQAAYTGPAGSAETAVAIDSADPRRVRFAATRTLGPREGLTVAVGFTAGVAHVPGSWERAAQGLRHEPATALGLLCAVCSLAILGGGWWWRGRDPRRGVIIPRYAPPPGVGPALARYLHLGRRVDERALPAVLLALAAEGAIRIERSGRDWRLLRRTRELDAALPPDVRDPGNSLLDAAVVDTGSDDGQRLLGRLRAMIEQRVPRQVGPDLFSTNRRIVALGAAFAAAALVLTAGHGLGPVHVALPEWIARSALLLGAGVAAAVSGSLLAGGPRVWTMLIAGAALLAAAALLVLAWPFAGPLPTLAAGVLGAAIGMALPLVPAWTPEGRRLLDEIAGFRNYLGVAEADRLNLENPPERVPELFERFLPYAYALGVEQRWAEQFDDVFARIGPTAAAAATHGLAGLDARDFARRIDRGADRGTQAMAAAAAAAATSPGAFRGGGSSSSGGGFSSGSSGGGRSGGGGGGGGGGGW